MDYSKLSKEVSYALRHAPWEYELELDHEGWVDVEQLLQALRFDNQWKLVNEHDLSMMIKVSDKKRHEMMNGKIRALYGHSVPQKIRKDVDTPPSILYHGTARHLVEHILLDGLRPMARQYVHLSADLDTAKLVGKRKDSMPALLVIQAEKASNESGIRFYRGNDVVWLADYVPGPYISQL
ncbi:RNA 2'-phosphotransferase [Paenibacillus xylaniclasticus]|uniref:RNA 2'-phosphotransferase n=1 Tax=Paenibacillus xylaniclasticus TaxID=588083 RepID=UPI000FD7B0F5|nr:MULTISPECIES: RNA 2'-phosphotransferase [Paenibacillus]GFN30049.1 putative RNA 2'-phosphotransferase [Paenibacillus curdlanolyticus]